MDGNCTINEIKNLCTKQYGGGVQFKMANNYSHLFKFSDTIDGSQTLLFYSDSSIQQIQHLKKAMRNVKDISRLGGVAARMMDEYFGDRTGLIEVSNRYNCLLKEADMAAQATIYKNAPISTIGFTDYLELADKHPAFVEFWNSIDDYIKDAIDNLYGRFSEFTTPRTSRSATNKQRD